MCVINNQILIDNVTVWRVYIIDLTNYMVYFTIPYVLFINNSKSLGSNDTPGKSARDPGPPSRRTRSGKNNTLLVRVSVKARQI